jgi:hypothetical protein
MDRHEICAAISFLLLCLCSCLSSCDNPQPGRAVVHWSAPRWDSTTIASAAKADLIILPLDRIYAPEFHSTIAQVRKINPSVKIIGYLPTLAVQPTRPEWYEAVPFERDYEASVGIFMARTLDGDTFSIWPGQYFLNPISGGTVNRELIHRIVRLLERYHRLNMFYPCDGVLHDYSMDWLPSGNTIDFNGDGVPFSEDAAERALLQTYQLAMYDSIRAVLGNDFIQIANGQPAQTNREFTRRLNGVFFENYPRQPWGYTAQRGFMQMMATEREGMLRKARGRTWNVLADWNAPSDMCYVSSLIAGCFYADSHGNALFTGWLNRPETGLALWNATASGSMVWRVFKRGTASITFNADGIVKECVFKEEATEREKK